MKTSAMVTPHGYIMEPQHGASRNRSRSRVRAYDMGAIFAFFVALQALLIFVSISFGATGSSFSRGADFLTCSYQPSASTVPVVTLHDGQAGVQTLGIAWNPAADPANAPVVAISMKGNGAASPQSDAIRAQSWVAALSAAVAWQNPWQGAAWTIDAGTAAAFDGTGMTAPLAVAMIASAAGIAYPADTAVIADLNPDGTLAPVPQIDARLAAASKAGIKRVVVPAVQRFGVASADGQLNDLVAVATGLGLECLPADTLAEAVEKVLGRPLPPLADDGSKPRLDAALSQRLETESRAQLAALQATRDQWPLAADQQAAMPLWQRALWTEAAVRFESGAADLKGGKMYAARGELGEANALVYALNSLRGGVPPVAQLQAEARTLKTAYRAALARVSDGQDDLQGGLAAAEMADWVAGVTAQIDGAENLVNQASSARSQALPEQKQMAAAQLALAVKKAEAQQERLASFAALSREMAAKGAVPVYDRAGLWLPQLVPAHLALGESFVLRLRKADGDLSRNLIYDANLTAQTRLLRDQKAVWDNRESVRQTVAATASEGAVQPVGFVPGDAYRAPLQAAVDVTPGARQSDTEQTLRWVNDYTEMALLYDRYFQFGGSYSPKEMSWTVQDRAILDSELLNADRAARQGIAAARITGVDTAVLELVYERASALRGSRLDGARMEALRQYWRCSLLGNMAWQLAAIPKAQALPARAPQVAIAAPADAESDLALAALAVVPVHPSAPGAPGLPNDPLPRSQPDPTVPPANTVTNNPNLDPQPIPVALTLNADESGTVRRALAVSY